MNNHIKRLYMKAGGQETHLESSSSLCDLCCSPDFALLGWDVSRQICNTEIFLTLLYSLLGFFHYFTDKTAEPLTELSNPPATSWPRGQPWYLPSGRGGGDFFSKPVRPKELLWNPWHGPTVSIVPRLAEAPAVNVNIPSRAPGWGTGGISEPWAMSQCLELQLISSMSDLFPLWPLNSIKNSKQTPSLPNCGTAQGHGGSRRTSDLPCSCSLAWTKAGLSRSCPGSWLGLLSGRISKSSSLILPEVLGSTASHCLPWLLWGLLNSDRASVALTCLPCSKKHHKFGSGFVFLFWICFLLTLLLLYY